jgi:SOS response regulatory protein OraA/RecX
MIQKRSKNYQYLTDRKYLNDKEFGKAFVKEKVKNKRIGPRALSRKYIPIIYHQKLIDSLIDDIYDEFDQNHLIETHLIKRKIEKHKPLNHKEKNRLTTFLQRKGFGWETI